MHQQTDLQYIPNGVNDDQPCRLSAVKLTREPWPSAATTSAGGRHLPSFENGLHVVSQAVPFSGIIPSSKYALTASLKQSLQAVNAAQ